MLNKEDAEAIAWNWIDAWNRHDLESIMSHYAEDVEFTSPFIIKLTGNSTGTLKGREMLRAYFKKALDTYSDLRFEFLKVFGGVNSMVIHYRSIKNLLASETIVLNDNGQIVKTFAHYNPVPLPTPE